ncbi:MAG TPA: DegT/DnrJ/EryC1/StrS family aminotransferase [Solirubrobacterales bacterium]|nr:DegT/DnrJ/EryC1/StrS family aminotransferase [Solirubrobacterales bacterium]
MSDWQVPLSAVRLTEADIEAANEVYRSGWLSMGPRTQELERAFAEYAGAEHCLAVSSCTSALHLAMAGAGLGPGDEAVVPSITFIASANAVAYTGARPVFADIAAVDRPWLSIESAERAITPETKAIVAVSYGGHPGDIEGLRQLADERGLALIEDAAHGSGSWLGDRHLGTFGLAGAISFSAGKNLGVGEGGVLLTDSEELAERARLMRWHGITRSIWERHRASTETYEVAGLGFNYRIDDPRAALASSRLGRLEDDNGRRAAIASAYRDQFGDLVGISPLAAPPENARVSNSMFAVIVDEGVDRDAFRDSLATRGIQTSVHFSPVHRFELYAASGADLPLSDAFAARTVSLPMFAEMEESQQAQVIEAVREALG